VSIHWYLPVVVDQNYEELRGILYSIIHLDEILQREAISWAYFGLYTVTDIVNGESKIGSLSSI